MVKVNKFNSIALSRGGLIQFEHKDLNPTKRVLVDRRKTVKGEPSKQGEIKDRRKGARRLEDVTITMEIADPDKVFASDWAFHEIVRKALEKNEILSPQGSDIQNQADVDYDEGIIYIETRQKLRDLIKHIVVQKGLASKVTDMGIFLGTTKSKQNRTSKTTQIKNQKTDNKVPDTPTRKGDVKFDMLGFEPENITIEVENIIFKVFYKCLSIAFPTSGNYENEALKQDVSLEQRIIFLAEKHFPRSERFTYKGIIEQVLDEVINKYNNLFSLQAELIHVTEKYNINKSAANKKNISQIENEIEDLKNSPIEDTIRTLYVYLEYFKEFIGARSLKNKIEHINKKINEKKIEVVYLKDILSATDEVIEMEKKLSRRKQKDKDQLLGYLNWYKEEINKEVYFTRFLWTNNLRGKKFIEIAHERTFAVMPN